MKGTVPALALSAAITSKGASGIVFELEGARFDNAILSALIYENSTATTYAAGALTAVSVDVVRDDGSAGTLASDIGLLLINWGPGPERPAQIGGGFNFYALRHYTWSNGHSDVPGTTCIDTITLDEPIAFDGFGGVAEPMVALGVLSANWPNGAWATWTGTITLHGLDWVEVPSPGALITLLAAGSIAPRRRPRR
jgi:hypothetical protein